MLDIKYYFYLGYLSDNLDYRDTMLFYYILPKLKHEQRVAL